jgi:hypothetical protein
MKDDERRFITAAATGDTPAGVQPLRAEYLRRKLIAEGTLDVDGFLTTRGEHVLGKIEGEHDGLDRRSGGGVVNKDRLPDITGSEETPRDELGGRIAESGHSLGDAIERPWDSLRGDLDSEPEAS